MRSRSLFPVMLAAALLLSSEGRSRAEVTAAPEVAVTAPKADFVFQATVPPALAPLATVRLPTAPSITPMRLSKDEKVVIIVCACVVGAILLFATIQIGSHNHPF